MSKVDEEERTYFFPNPDDIETPFEITVDNVRDIKVSESGGHRLTCSNGAMAYIPSGWIGIEILSDHGWEM